MLSGVSHDLRTPLTRMRLGLSMMDDVEAAPLLEDVDEMQHLVDAFLDFAHADASDTLEAVDPHQVLDDALASQTARSAMSSKTMAPAFPSISARTR